MIKGEMGGRTIRIAFDSQIFCPEVHGSATATVIMQSKPRSQLYSMITCSTQ